MHNWRTRWRSLLVLAIMIGLTGAASLAAIAGALRSASALDRFHGAGQTLDVFISADVIGHEPSAFLDLLDGPLVESTNDLVFLFVDVDEIGVMFAPTSRRGMNVERGVLLEGRRADPDEPDELTLSETAAAKLGLHVGDLFEFGSLSPQQAEDIFSSGKEQTSLDGPQLHLRVVGITRNGFDLNAFGQGTALTVTTPAFWEKYGPSIGIGSRSHMVRLVDKPGAQDQFTAAYGGEHLPSINVGQGESSLADSISVVTAALLVMALVIVVSGLLWIGSVTARHQRAAGPDIDVLRALGTTAGERRLVAFSCVVPALLAGVVLAPLGAIALSPLFPAGTARRIDPDPGLHADGATLLIGATTLLAVLGLIAAIAAARLVSAGRRLEPRHAACATARRPGVALASSGAGHRRALCTERSFALIRAHSACARRRNRGRRRTGRGGRCRREPPSAGECPCSMGHDVGRGNRRRRLWGRPVPGRKTGP